ncbi:Glutathione S-transferase [Hondaea fermentalgiana]|uniref:Glutathione S-transferase n=1 Tax=Hondaea fermentalgiana TaxID=2315210 RepID=A0A2R5GDW7_9STRA|nr:Glutathione S-transferase [Hondaea fermentalgiana]|eukprot:GBG29130.1 Glutathione S-transferase [Hondaea fermentalgiana]
MTTGEDETAARATKRVKTGEEEAAVAQEEGEKKEIPVEEKRELTLYSYWRSSCSWRVRMALAAKGIEYRYKAVSLIKDGGEHRQKEYETMNPMQQVPALVDVDEFVVTQSVAILEYLEERYPDTPRLLPDDVKQRARVRRIVEIINSGTQPIQNMRVLNKIEALGGNKLAWAKEAIEEGFVALEAELQRVPNRKEGDYCIGETLTLADCALVPQVYNANRFKVDMTRFPLIEKVNKALEDHPAVQKSHPDFQPDAPMN